MLPCMTASINGQHVQNLGALSPPPPPYAPPLLFTLPLQQTWLALPSSGLPEGLRSTPAHARIGRGGRLLFDRVHPVTYDPLNGVAHSDSGVSLLQPCAPCQCPGQSALHCSCCSWSDV